MSVNGPISPKQCYYEMDYSFYSFYWLDSLETWLDHNSTYYRSLSKNSDVKPRISHYDSQNLQYKTHPEFWPSHRRIFKTNLYYKTRLILETRRYFSFFSCHQTSTISRTLAGNRIVDHWHSEVVGTLPVGTAPTTSSFLTKHLATMDRTKTTARPWTTVSMTRLLTWLIVYALCHKPQKWCHKLWNRQLGPIIEYINCI